MVNTAATTKDSRDKEYDSWEYGAKRDEMAVKIDTEMKTKGKDAAQKLYDTFVVERDKAYEDMGISSDRLPWVKEGKLRGITPPRDR